MDPLAVFTGIWAAVHVLYGVPLIVAPSAAVVLECRLAYSTPARLRMVGVLFLVLCLPLIATARDARATYGEVTLWLEGVGWLYAMQALVGALAAWVAPWVARKLQLGRMFVVGMVVMGAGWLVAATLTSNFLAVIPIGVALGGVSWINVAVTTLRHRLTPPDKLGRVVSASRTLSWIGIPAGAALGGVIGESVGLVPVFTAASILVIVIGLALAATPLWRDPVGPVRDGS